MPIGPQPPDVKSPRFDEWLTRFYQATAYGVPPPARKDSPNFNRWLADFYAASGVAAPPPPKHGIDNEWVTNFWAKS